MLPVTRHRAGLHRCLQLHIILLWTLCQELVLADQVSPRTTVPAPIVVPASNNWEGNDGPWSSFTIEIGTPAQSVNVFISTASYQTWGVDPEGCTSSDPTDCSTERGRFFNYSASMSWVPNTSNITTTIYDLDLESDLGYTGKGRYGFDNITLGYVGGGGPTLANQTVASIATKEFFLGEFGLKPQASNFTSLTDPIPSFMQNLRSQDMIPSVSWAYTAGNKYRLDEVYGSLTLGGYDTSKFVPNDLTFTFGPQDDRELLVQLNKISTGQDTSLLPSAIPMFLDSTIPYIYLPEAACTMFESTFGLVWDNATQLYLLTDAQHNALQTQNPNITFTLGNLTTSTTVDIILPYSAFDLTVSYPIVANATRYFPLKRANDSSQYTLGRTFFQEAYVIADYDRRNFSVSQCKWDAAATENIVAIFPPSNSSSSPATNTGPGSPSVHSLPIAAIAGGAGAVVILIIALLILCIVLRRRRKAKGIKLAENTAPTTNANDETIIKAELDAQDHKAGMHENTYEVEGDNDRKWMAEVAGHENEIVEIDPHGRKWPPPSEAVEIGPSGRTSPIYEMAAEEVAIEMSSVGNARRRSEVRRPMSFEEGDDSSPRELVSASSGGRSVFGGYRYYRREGTDIVSPISRTFSPASEGASEGFSP